MWKSYVLFGLVLLASCMRSTRFQLLPSSMTGIDFVNAINDQDSLNVLNYEYIYNGAGVGIADLNCDGLQDIILVGNQVSPRIYLNLGHFRFRDISDACKGLSNSEWFSGVAIGDVNQDGWPDIYFTATENADPAKRKNRLWINRGTNGKAPPTFVEMAEKYGIADQGQSLSAAFFDYDLDGDLDLYVMNNTLNQRTNSNYREKINDGSAANNDRLYRNNGNGTFTDVTYQAGIVYEGYGLGLAIGDVNKDGYPDIYISNDFLSNDLLYINQGNGTFKNEIEKYISYQSRSSMGNDMADVNNDGNLDMFTLDMMPVNYAKKKQTINGFSYLFNINDFRFGYEHQFLRNMLHIHNGFLNGQMLPYSEVGQYAGVFQSDWSWSPLFADYDNDGDKDLIITNGYPKDMTDKDWTRYKARVYGFLAGEQDVISMLPASKVPNVAFENTGNLHFVNKSADWLPHIPSFSNGAAFVDLDNDGDLDYVVNNINDKAFVFRNNSVERKPESAGYIRIKLTGKAGNNMALGAKVELWDNGNYQYQENYLTRGYASSMDPVIHFGLGKNTFVDSIRITWPASRYVSVLTHIPANQTLEVREENARPPYPKVDQTTKPDMLFTSCDSLLDYRHQQQDFADFFLKQRIIPHKFSQIGPVIVPGDLNHDGQTDLIMGSTNELPTMVFVRKGPGFVRTYMEGLTGMRNYTEAGLCVVDMNRDGWNDVVAVAGGYEQNEEKDYKHYLYVNHQGSFSRIELPIPSFPASVVKPDDFDHDGYPDLFVGSRVKWGMYPYANHSWVIRNNHGTLQADSSLRLNLGMVTDAIWTDYDNDGWDDLLVVREWNSPVLLKNMQGKALVPQNIPELEKMHGIWYSLAEGDFNRDGYPDYILGNLGENNRFTISNRYPLRMYVIDLDMDGTLDPLMSGYWPDGKGKMTEYPVNYLDELLSQSSYFVKKIKNYTSFSYTSMNDLLDKEAMKRIDFKLYVNTASSYILWNNKGKFTWEKLPEQVQFSPVTRMIVMDLNGDNYPDVLVGGNDYSYDYATGSFDANKGIVLINQVKNRNAAKTPSFKVLVPAESGFSLEGMVQSLQLIDGTPKLVVAGLNRDNARVFQCKIR